MGFYLKLREHGKPVSGVQHYTVVGAANCADADAEKVYAEETQKENEWTDERGNKQTTGDSAVVAIAVPVSSAAPTTTKGAK